MADVIDYVAGTPFVVRTRSSLVTNPRVRWHNTFEIRATEDGDTAILAGMASAIVGFLIQITFDYVRVDEVTVSTWVADSHPYNPLAFFTEVYNQRGLIPTTPNLPVALRQTVFIKRVTASGLPGKLFVRGMLISADIVASDGEWILQNATEQEGMVTDAVTENGLAEHMNGLTSPSWAFALIGNDGETRWITQFAVAGTSDVKLNHKYFDRAP